MPILFNEPNSDSLLDVIKQEVSKILIKRRTGWVFYAVTCYFTVEATKELIAEVNKKLEGNLSEVHILVDVNEWIKSLLIQDEIRKDLSKITGLDSNLISFIPISYNSKLFHAKSYALINLETSASNNNNGFAIITSGNLTESGLKHNIEIGQIIYDLESLKEFVKLFLNLKNNYEGSTELEEEQKKLQLAVQVLSQGVFYHKWLYEPDLAIRLELSSDEKKRLKDLAENEETLKNIKNFKLQELKNISDDTINIQSIFDYCSKPIPSEVWGSYSIDTPLGKWVPLEISKLIEEEIKESRKILIPLLKEKGDKHKIQELCEKYNKFINDKIKEKILDYSQENWSAVKTWKKKVTRFFQDENLLNMFVCSYEKISLTITKLETDEISSIYERIKDFYSSPDNHKKLGELIAELKIDNGNSTFQKMSDLSTTVKKIFKKNRLGESYNHRNDSHKDVEIEKGEEFIAFYKIPGQKQDEYKQLNGIFIEIKNHQTSPIILYKTSDDKQEELPIGYLISFKKRKKIK